MERVRVSEEQVQRVAGRRLGLVQHAGGGVHERDGSGDGSGEARPNAPGAASLTFGKSIYMSRPFEKPFCPIIDK